MTALALKRRLLALDELVFLRVRELERPRLTRLMRGFTALGDASTWAAQGLAVGCLPPDGVRLAVHMALAAALATVVAQVLKRGLRRPRPSAGIAGFHALAADPDAFSFPSGHTAVAFAMAMALHALAPQLALLELGLAASIASSRVYLGAHYPLDVTCGALLGLACGAVAALA